MILQKREEIISVASTGGMKWNTGRPECKILSLVYFIDLTAVLQTFIYFDPSANIYSAPYNYQFRTYNV